MLVPRFRLSKRCCVGEKFKGPSASAEGPFFLLCARHDVFTWGASPLETQGGKWAVYPQCFGMLQAAYKDLSSIGLVESELRGVSLLILTSDIHFNLHRKA